MLSIANFADRLCEAVRKKGSFLCAGPDPQLRYMPPHLIREAIELHGGRTFAAIGWLFYEFNCQLINAIHDIVPCIKPQMAFYEIYGKYGVEAFEKTVAYAKHMGLLVIEDAKRNDGGDTADAYADGHIGQVPFFGPDGDVTNLTVMDSPIRVDCLTVTPYIGADCVGRFVQRVKQFGTGIFVVTKTSFKPNSVVEQLETPEDAGLCRVWQAVARMVNVWGEGTEGACGLRNVGVVMGATYPVDAVTMRNILPNAIFLVPGYGSQGAGADEAVAGVRPDGFGAVVNNSRKLIYAWQDAKGKYRCESEKFAEAARSQAIDDRDALVAACKRANKWPHS